MIIKYTVEYPCPISLIMKDNKPDESLSNLKEEMREILFKDQNLIKNNNPAINRLTHLNDIMKKLYTLRSHVDSELLHILKEWLEPLPDKTLPNITIISQMVQFLLSVNVTRDQLVNSEIGKIILFYSKNNEYDNEVRKLSKKLVKKWTNVAISDAYY